MASFPDRADHLLHTARWSNRRADVRLWHIATFRCAAEFGRYRGIADIEQAAPIKLDW